MNGMELAQPINISAQVTEGILEILQPFRPDDGHKGTFLIMRIAGMEQHTALKLIKRKYRSWQNWCTIDPDFKRLDEQIPALSQRFGGEARVIRTAILDISIIEAGIGVFQKILQNVPVTDGMWAYATKLASLRVPMMGAREDSGSPWEHLANSIRNTIKESSVKELTIMQEPDGTKSITAKETTVWPNPLQEKTMDEAVRRILQEGLDGTDTNTNSN